MTFSRQYRAGQSVEDHCRSCHEDRTHTVIVVDGNAQPLRVACDFCRSEHNYRGGPQNGRIGAGVATAPHKGGPYRLPEPFERASSRFEPTSPRQRTRTNGSAHDTQLRLR